MHCHDLFLFPGQLVIEALDWRYDTLIVMAGKHRMGFAGSNHAESRIRNKQENGSVVVVESARLPPNL